MTACVLKDKNVLFQTKSGQLSSRSVWVPYNAYYQATSPVVKHTTKCLALNIIPECEYMCTYKWNIVQPKTCSIYQVQINEADKNSHKKQTDTDFLFQCVLPGEI